MLSTKDLVFKERPTKKLTERYRALHDRGGSIQIGKVVAAKLDEDSSSGKCKR